jgi:hypothetical protein
MPATGGFWSEFLDEGYWGNFNSLTITDIKNDGELEIVLGSDSLVQLREVVTSPLIISKLFLPAIIR